VTEDAPRAPRAPTDADLIREHLQRLGLSQREAARQLDIDDRTMRYYSAGKSPVPAVVFHALRQLEQIRFNERVLALVADGTMRAFDGEDTPERLRKANKTLRAAIEILLPEVRASAAETRAIGDAAPDQPVPVRPPTRASLFKPEWSALESDDLRTLLEYRIGGPGQSSGEPGDHRFYLPLGGDACRVAIRFDGTTICAVEPGPAFDAQQWSEISAAIDALRTTKPNKVGRDIAFSAFRVTGWWLGERSGVQILPPPPDAPTVPSEMGQHPFVLEFPIHGDADWRVMNARRRREHRKLALLLNVLLRGRVNCETRQAEQAWACVGLPPDGNFRSEWLQLSYFANVGQVVADSLSQFIGAAVHVIEPEAYHAKIGHDGSPLCVPDDLDELICTYRDLPLEYRTRFDRALFWLDVASRQWVDSMSSSFASLVSAIEALTVRGATHELYCPQCGEDRPHDVPGPTALFRNFFETHAPGLSQKKRRDQMYDLRSSISHGSKLLAWDEGRAWGWDPPWSDQRELHDELWTLTRIAMRSYLRNPAGATSAAAK
jgi:hypothetical protein